MTARRRGPCGGDPPLLQWEVMQWFHWAPKGEQRCLRCLGCTDAQTEALLEALRNEGYVSRSVSKLGKRLETWWLDGRFATSLREVGLHFSSEILASLEQGQKVRLWRKVQHRAFGAR